MTTQPAAGAFSPHDHRRCVASALSAAERICAERQLRFTPLRRRVLELLWESHRPIGAYALLDRLREDGLGSQPPTVYRALDFLISNGLAHRVNRFNAFVGCAHPENRHSPAFLICRDCERIGELQSDRLARELDHAASDAQFSPMETAIEIEGLCAACAERES